MEKHSTNWILPIKYQKIEDATDGVQAQFKTVATFVRDLIKALLTQWARVANSLNNVIDAVATNVTNIATNAAAIAAHSTAYVKVSDTKAWNVDGGTFTAGAWRTRDINTEDSDTSSICSIASNQITLAAGTYTCAISSPVYRADQNVPRLYNITDSSVELLGGVCFGYFTDSGFSVATIVGKFTVGSAKALEVQHYGLHTQAGNGLGVKMGVAGINSVYTVAEFWKVA